MPDERQHPYDHAYSDWHRRRSISRFMTMSEAESLWFIDCDWIEACRHCSEPLLLVEATRDLGQAKSHSILLALARRADVPAAIVYYTLGDLPQPDSACLDIASFRVVRIWPEPSDELTYTPAEWAEMLLRLRRRHDSRGHST